MIVYKSAGDYIDSCETLDAKIAAVEAIIQKLLLTAADSAADAGVTEYWLNDGQTQIKCIYRNVDQIHQSINSFEKLKQTYRNQRNGRMTKLVDEKNFMR